MEQNHKKIQLNVYTASIAGGLKVSTADTRQVISATNNRAQYFAELAEKYKDEAKLHRDNAKYYAEQNSDVTFEYIDNVKNSLLSVIETKQPNGDYALRKELPQNISELENDIGYSTKQELLKAVPSQENCEGRFLYTNGKETCWKGINSFSLFDTKLSDHVLEGEESFGWAPQGTFVYKNAIAGARYGYPDFYNKCLGERSSATATEVTLGSSTITMYMASNGHQYYDIANKDVIDTFYNTMGSAWFYGVDTENERIFLPRKTLFKLNKQDSLPVSVYGNGRPLGFTLDKNDIYFMKQTNTAEEPLQIVPTSVLNWGLPGYKTEVADATKSNYSIGLHPNASISGIVGTTDLSSYVQEDSQKYLYICVGNTTSYEGMTEVVNQGMEILKQVNEGIASRADGQFVLKRKTLGTATAIGEYIYDLSDYLPVDNYEYEVQFEASVCQTSGVCNFRLARNGELDTKYVVVLIAQNGWHSGHATLKVGTDRKIYGRKSNEVSANFALYAVSYRRLGTNQ